MQLEQLTLVGLLTTVACYSVTVTQTLAKLKTILLNDWKQKAGRKICTNVNLKSSTKKKTKTQNNGGKNNYK